MEQVSNVLARIKARDAMTTAQQPNIDEAAGRVVNALIKELKAIFPAWRQAWADDDDLKAYKKTMTKAFIAERIFNIEQIRFGVEACRQLPSDFVPSVGRFIAMCRPGPEALGLPSESEAYAEAARNAYPGAGQVVWSHPAVSHAAREVGLYNLSTMPLKASRMLFNRAYEIVCRMVANGEPLKPILIGLPETTVGRRTLKVGQDALAKLRGKVPADE